MTRRTPARFLSAAFLAFAALLVFYGLFGLSRSAWYQGEYFDDRLLLFDNGVYPFLWGSFLLVLGQLLRLRLRRPFMGMAAVAGLALLLWKRATIPTNGHAGEELFPDAELLNELMVVCLVLLGLALADRYARRVIDLVVVKPYRMLFRKRSA
jgi:hypothetical protein